MPQELGTKKSEEVFEAASKAAHVAHSVPRDPKYVASDHPVKETQSVQKKKRRSFKQWLEDRKNTPHEKLTAKQRLEKFKADHAEKKANKPPKKRFARLRARKHWKAGVTVVAIVVVAGGAGFWVWHNTPEFCDAICHNPQDPYNPTYYAEPGESATDKWGNTVEDASSMLSATHRAYGDLVCIDCHVPSIVEQVTEGIRWAVGDFYNPLSERDLDNLVAYRNITGEEFCLNESCHNMTKSDLTAATAVYSRNPHEWHHSEYTCSDCHKSHRASILVCSECHEDAVIPDSWISVAASRDLTTIYQSYDQEKM